MQQVRCSIARITRVQAWEVLTDFDLGWLGDLSLIRKMQFKILHKLGKYSRTVWRENNHNKSV